MSTCARTQKKIGLLLILGGLSQLLRVNSSSLEKSIESLDIRQTEILTFVTVGNMSRTRVDTDH